MKHTCKCCNYETSRKENYDRHLNSKKHKVNKSNDKPPENTIINKDTIVESIEELKNKI